MILRRLLFATLPLIATVAFAQASPNFELLDKDIVRIHTHRAAHDGADASDETGVGVIAAVSPGTLRIITAAHVIRDAESITVTFSSDKVAAIPAKALPSLSDALDLGVVEVHPPPGTRLPDHFVVLQWLRNEDLHQSEHLWTVNSDWDPVPNSVFHLDHEGNAQLFEYTRESIGEGFSGGPVFNDSGQLVGIHTAETRKADYNLSVAVKIQAALDTLNALGYNAMNALKAGNPPSGGNAPQQVGAGGAKPPQPQNAQVLWRNLNNNQLYLIALDQGHIYIRQRNNAVVADLTQKTDKKGDRYVGNSSLSTCPGSGYMEIDSISDGRIDGRIEVKPQTANAHCGGVFGAMRQMQSIAFIREQ